MTYRFEKNNDTICWEWMTNWKLVIILSNMQLTYNTCYDRYEEHYAIYYNSDFKYYYINVNSYQLKIIEYLVSNNIGAIINTTKYTQILILNPHILLELI
jgi:hypothetical protein